MTDNNEKNKRRLVEAIYKVLLEFVGQKSYNDNPSTRTSVRTGGYGGVNQHRGNRGASDDFRGDKQWYFNGVADPEFQVVTPEQLERKKIAWFKRDPKGIDSSESLFTDNAEMGYEINDIQRATKGNVQWKIVTDDPKHRRHNFWLFKLPDDQYYRILKPNALGRYADAYNNTLTKRNTV